MDGYKATPSDIIILYTKIQNHLEKIYQMGYKDGSDIKTEIKKSLNND